MSEKNKKTYNRNLFWEFFKIGIFTIGGGMAMIPQIQQVVVKDKGWLSEEEMVDCIAVSQSMPGVIAINSATYIGRKTNGFSGAAAATTGVIAPSFLIIILIVSFLGMVGENHYIQGAFVGIKAAVCGLILISAGQAGQTDPERTVSMDPGCCSLSCHRRVWDHCCMGSPGRCCGRYFI